jgi:hypothetical protein
VGLWEYDPGREEIAWVSFIPQNQELEAAVERTAAFLRTELGDARSFSLDSPKSRQPGRGTVVPSPVQHQWIRGAQ